MYISFEFYLLISKPLSDSVPSLPGYDYPLGSVNRPVPYLIFLITSFMLIVFYMSVICT